MEKEAEKTPRPPPKKKPKQDLPVPKIKESEEKTKIAAHVAAKKVEPVRATTKAPPKKVEKTEAPKPSTASLPKPVVKGRKTETDLGEFFKYKNDKGKVRRRTTNPQPFSFMVREEQKKKAREAAKQASAANVYKDDELEFSSKPAVRTTTAATVNRLAQPKKVAAPGDDEKKEARRIAKARRTTRALSPKFRTAARAASRKFSTTENKPAEGSEKEEPKKVTENQDFHKSLTDLLEQLRAQALQANGRKVAKLPLHSTR